MPKTPNSTAKINPYFTKSISKSLLIPCRQMGLSRKIKTPNSFRKRDLSFASSNSDTTLTNLRKKSDLEEGSETCSVKIEEKGKRVKKSVSKCLIADEEDQKLNENKVSLVKEGSPTTSDHGVPLSSLKIDSFNESPEDKKKIEEKVKKVDSDHLSTFKISKKKSEDSPKKNSSCLKEDNSSQKRKDKVNVKKKVKRIIDSDDDESLFETSIKKIKNSPKSLHKGAKSESSSSNEIGGVDESIKKKMKIENEPKKKKVPTNGDHDNLTVSSSSSSQDSKTDEEVPLSSLKVKTCLQKEIENSKDNKNRLMPDIKKDEKKKSTKLKRSLSLKKSPEEIKECSIQLSPLQLKSAAPKITEADVSKLQKEVNEKRKFLEELKQAEINKRLHNVEELEELTATWKNGCTLALNDLLPHVQDHINIDMATLLKNLGIPENLIKLSESGDLI